MKPQRRERRIILAALFIALSVAVGYLLAGVPNVELMTLCVFLSGVFLGCGLGAVVGILSIFLYSVFNPFGPPLLPLIITQLVGFALIGLSGGLLRVQIGCAGRRAIVVSAVAGLILTVVYDLLTTVATAFVFLGGDGFIEGFMGVFIAGALFLVIHTISNTVVFAVAVVPVVRVIAAFERGSRI
jgi:hypothetical protein